MTTVYVDRSENLASLQAQLAASNDTPDLSGASANVGMKGRYTIGGDFEHTGAASVNMMAPETGPILSTAFNPKTGSPVAADRITPDTDGA